VQDRSIDSLLDSDLTNDPNIFFPYLGVNSSQVDYIRLLGNNLFGFEDWTGGGDFDYNDVIVQIKVFS
jgi:hypothetical protein